MALIKLEQIQKAFGKGKSQTRVLRSINLAIERGEFVAIMGPSGSGKSTLMNVIGLLDQADSGSYSLADVAVKKLSDKELAELRRQRIGFVFQSFNLLPRLTVAANVALPMVYNHVRRGQRVDRTRQLLRQVGLSARWRAKPTTLSGGEMQRVAIARALANQPSIILADEPTGNLDSKTGQTVVRILQQLNQKGATVIVVTHDESIAKRAHRIIKLKDGRVTR